MMEDRFRYRDVCFVLLLLTAALVCGLILAAQTKVQPSSHIIAIDPRTGVVTAKVNATGEDFQFTINNPALLRTLKAGQGVYANFRTRQVSLDGKNVVGTIVSVGPSKEPPAPSVPAKPATAPIPAQPEAKTPRSDTQPTKPAQPPTNPQPASSPSNSGTSTACCAITSIDLPARLVTAKDNSTGNQFVFSVPNALPIQNVHSGQPVWANFKSRKVSLDGRAACCDIIGISAPTNTAGSGLASQGNAIHSTSAGSGKVEGAMAQPTATVQIDPCAVATPDQLKTLLQVGIQPYFPYAVQNGGEHIKISDPNIEQVTCPRMNLKVGAHIKYSQTRGFPQFEEGGSVELESPLVGMVQFRGIPGGNVPVTPANFLRATAVLADVRITSLRLDNVPGWIDLTWIRDCLNGKYSNWGCSDVISQMSFDVTSFVKFYLDPGHTLSATQQSSAASGNASAPKIPHLGEAESTAVVSSIDRRSGLVAAKDKASGRTFYIRLSDAGSLASITNGTGVHADSGKLQVSFDGTQPIGTIVPAIFSELPDAALRIRFSAGAPNSIIPARLAGVAASAVALGTDGGRSTLVTKPLGGVTVASPNSYAFRQIEVPGAASSANIWGDPIPRGLPLGINNSGEIVGYFVDTNGRGHGFINKAGKFLTIDARAPSVAVSSLDGIGNMGGFAGTYMDTNHVYHGFGELPSEIRETRSSTNTVDDPNAYYGWWWSGTQAFGTNRSGDIVGRFEDAGQHHNGFLYRGLRGTFITLNVPGSTITTPVGINDHDEIVGWFCNGYYPNRACHGFLYSSGNFGTLDLPGAILTLPLGINVDRQIAGTFIGSDHASHCFLYSAEVFTQVDVPEALTTACYGLNDMGQIVGAYATIDRSPSPHIVYWGFVATPSAAQSKSTSAPASGSHSSTPQTSQLESGNRPAPLKSEAGRTTVVRTSGTASIPAAPEKTAVNAPTALPGLQSAPSASCTTSPALAESEKQMMTLCLYATACCAVTSIDLPARLVTAKDNSTGNQFVFSVPNAPPIQNVHSGQPVWANFKTRQVSLDGVSPCCKIVSIGPADTDRSVGSVDPAKPAGSVDAAKPVGSINAVRSPGVPAAQVVTVDSPAGLVMGREIATGRLFQFRLRDPALLKSLAPGQGLYINYNARQVSLDGKSSDGIIVTIGPPGKGPGALQAPNASQAGGGLSSATQPLTSPLQSSGLVCSTKPKHRDEPVAQGVIVPSGATIYCRLGPLHSAAPITIQTSIPGVAHAPATVAPTSTQEKGAYADFQITTTPIPQTVLVTITAMYGGIATSTSVTLARAAIKDLSCRPAPTLTYDAAQGPCNLVVEYGIAGLAKVFLLELTAPADPDGFSIQVTGSDGYSGQVSVSGGASQTSFSIATKAVGVETPVIYSVVDPLDGSLKAVNAVLEPPLVRQTWFGDGVSAFTNVSGVPLNGIQVRVSARVFGDPPPDGTPLKIEYGGTPNLITGPAGVAVPPRPPGVTAPFGDVMISFPVTVLPCGAPPCQVTVTVGSSAGTCRTAALDVRP